MDLDFVKLVYETRKAQRAYFRTRSAENLEAAKNLEAALDLEIEARLKPRPPGLFDAGDERTWPGKPHTEDRL